MPVLFLLRNNSFLYKWRDREISYAGKWGLRYFVLQGKTLSYFADEHDNRPRRTIDLSHCIVRSDGTKKAGTYHVFCVYLASENLQTAESLLLRLSTESKSEAAQWIDMICQACAIADLDAEGTGTWTETTSPPNRRGVVQLVGGLKSETRSASRQVDGRREGPPVVDEIPPVVVQSAEGVDFENDDWGNTPIDTDTPLKDGDAGADADGDGEAEADMDGMSPKMMQRVRSTTMILRKSQSRSLMARQILHKRAPTVFSSSGANLIDRAAASEEREAAGRAQQLAASKAIAPMRVKSFPAFKYVTSAVTPPTTATLLTCPSNSRMTLHTPAPSNLQPSTLTLTLTIPDYPAPLPSLVSPTCISLASPRTVDPCTENPKAALSRTTADPASRTTGDSSTSA